MPTILVDGLRSRKSSIALILNISDTIRKQRERAYLDYYVLVIHVIYRNAFNQQTSLLHIILIPATEEIIPSQISPLTKDTDHEY